MKESASQSKGIAVRKEATPANTRFYVLPQVRRNPEPAALTLP